MYGTAGRTTVLDAPRPRSRVINRNLNSLSLQNLCRGRSITAAALHAAIYHLYAALCSNSCVLGTTRSSVRSVFCQRLSSKNELAPIRPRNRLRSLPKSPKIRPDARFRFKNRFEGLKKPAALAACNTLATASTSRASFLQPESIDSWRQRLRGRFFAVLRTDENCWER